MAIPFILLAAAVAAGGLGVNEAYKAKNNIDKAKSVGEEIDVIIKTSNKALKNSKEAARRSLENLGKTKLIIFSTNMETFVDNYKKLKEVDFCNLGVNDLENFKPTSETFKKLDNETVVTKKIVIKNGLEGIGSGALIATGCYGAVMYGGFTVASTGTAIGTLHGIAATNATLAWLGGGSIASGGFGMAGGTVVLGGLVLGPALLIGGVLVNKQAKSALYSALEEKDKALKFQETVNKAMVALSATNIRAGQINYLLQDLDYIFGKKIKEFVKIIEEYGCDYSLYDIETRKKVCMTAMLAIIIKSIMDTPLLHKNGALNPKVYNMWKKFKKIRMKSDFDDLSILVPKKG